MSARVIWRQHYRCEADARAAIVEEAMSWLETPWAHAHDLKGGAVDCAMLLVRVFVDCRILAPFDPRPYPSQWFLHHEAARFLTVMGRYGHPVDHDAPGDVRMYNFGKHAAHGAVVIDAHSIVHASLPAGRVIRESIHSNLGKYAGSYSVFG